MHLFVVINDADPDGQHLLLSISTIRKNKYYDKGCILQPGDHDFLKDESFVYYKEATLRHTLQISRCVDKEVFIPRNDFDEAVFDRICEGIEKSIHSPKWVKTYYQSYC